MVNLKGIIDYDNTYKEQSDKAEKNILDFIKFVEISKNFNQVKPQINKGVTTKIVFNLNGLTYSIGYRLGLDELQTNVYTVYHVKVESFFYQKITIKSEENPMLELITCLDGFLQVM